MKELISTRFNATAIYECVEGNQAQHDVSMLESVAARQSITAVQDNPAYESAM